MTSSLCSHCDFCWADHFWCSAFCSSCHIDLTQFWMMLGRCEALNFPRRHPHYFKKTFDLSRQKYIITGGRQHANAEENIISVRRRNGEGNKPALPGMFVTTTANSTILLGQTNRQQNNLGTNKLRFYVCAKHVIFTCTTTTTTQMYSKWIKLLSCPS